MTEVPAVSPVDLYYLVSQVLHNEGIRERKDVARSIVDTIAAHGLTVYRTEGPKVRQAEAIQEARQHLRDSVSRFVRTGAQAAIAEALQGILIVMLEQLESQWDTPCDCFAGLPQLSDSDESLDTGKDETQ